MDCECFLNRVGAATDSVGMSNIARRRRRQTRSIKLRKPDRSMKMVNGMGLKRRRTAAMMKSSLTTHRVATTTVRTRTVRRRN